MRQQIIWIQHPLSWLPPWNSIRVISFLITHHVMLGDLENQNRDIYISNILLIAAPSISKRFRQECQGGANLKLETGCQHESDLQIIWIHSTHTTIPNTQVFWIWNGLSWFRRKVVVWWHSWMFLTRWWSREDERACPTSNLWNLENSTFLEISWFGKCEGY